MDDRKLIPSEKNSSLMSSTASTFQSVLKPKVYSDGIGVGQFDFRLSHIPGNLAYLSDHYMKEAIAAAVLLFCLTEGSAKGAKSVLPELIYFSDKTHTTDYMLATSQNLKNIINRIKGGVCDVVTEDEISSSFSKIKSWGGVGLFRNTNDTALKSVETCLESMINEEIKAYWQHQNMTLGLGLGLGLGGAVVCIIIIGAIAWFCAKRTRERNVTNARSPLIRIEVEELNDSESEVVENDKLILKKTKESEPERKFETRLKKINFDFDKIPADFLDPVFYFVMDNPVVVRDGFSADQSTIEAALKGNPNAKCLIERGYKLEDTQIENKTLKNAIEAFVAKKELKHQKKLEQEKIEKEGVISLSQSQDILFANDTERMEEKVESKEKPSSLNYPAHH